MRSMERLLTFQPLRPRRHPCFCFARMRRLALYNISTEPLSGSACLLQSAASKEKPLLLWPRHLVARCLLEMHGNLCTQEKNQCKQILWHLIRVLIVDRSLRPHTATMPAAGPEKHTWYPMGRTMKKAAVSAQLRVSSTPTSSS